VTAINVYVLGVRLAGDRAARLARNAGGLTLYITVDLPARAWRHRADVAALIRLARRTGRLVGDVALSATAGLAFGVMSESPAGPLLAAGAVTGAVAVLPVVMWVRVWRGVTAGRDDSATEGTVRWLRELSKPDLNKSEEFEALTAALRAKHVGLRHAVLAPAGPHTWEVA
jgi:hypothetical protein